jgi:glycerol-1-phosphate dehydrogenase [NAD(P)+]
MSIAQLDSRFTCACGREHRIPIVSTKVASGILPHLGQELRELGAWQRLMLVADENTWAAAGSDVHLSLKGQFAVDTVVFPGSPRLRPDETSISRVLNSIVHLPDVLLAVGSGTITDLVRYVSASKLDIPFVCIPTAPSMDGYASTVSAMSFSGFKVTMNAKPPLAIFADLDILSNAPSRLMAAGAADLFGKYTALMDWSIARDMQGEYYCPYVEGLVRKATDSCSKDSEALKMRRQDAVYNLMEGLILSGLGILMVGNSRPASGSEHHLSHFWEMKEQASGRTEHLHGEKVGVASILAAKVYRFLLEQDLKGLCFDPNWRTLGLDLEEYTRRLGRVFGPLAEQLPITDKRVPGDDNPEVLDFASRLSSALCQVAADPPSAVNIEESLRMVGAPTTCGELDLPREWVREGILYSREVRERYTIFTLLAQLGLLSRAAEKIADES